MEMNSSIPPGRHRQSNVFMLFKLSLLTAQLGRPLRSWAAARAAVKTSDTMEAFIVADGSVQRVFGEEACSR